HRLLRRREQGQRGRLARDRPAPAGVAPRRAVLQPQRLQGEIDVHQPRPRRQGGPRMSHRDDGITRRTFVKAAGTALGAMPTALRGHEAGPPMPTQSRGHGTQPSETGPQSGGKTNVDRRYEDVKAEFDEYGYVVLPDAIPRDHAARVEERLKGIMSRRPD